MYRDDLSAALSRLEAVAKEAPRDAPPDVLAELGKTIEGAILARPLNWPLVSCYTSTWTLMRAYYNGSVRVAVKLVSGLFRRGVVVYVVSQTTSGGSAPILDPVNATRIMNRQLYNVVLRLPALQAAFLLGRKS